MWVELRVDDIDNSFNNSDSISSVCREETSDDSVLDMYPSLRWEDTCQYFVALTSMDDTHYPVVEEMSQEDPSTSLIHHSVPTNRQWETKRRTDERVYVERRVNLGLRRARSYTHFASTLLITVSTTLIHHRSYVEKRHTTTAFSICTQRSDGVICVFTVSRSSRSVRANDSRLSQSSRSK